MNNRRTSSDEPEPIAKYEPGYYWVRYANTDGMVINQPFIAKYCAKENIDMKWHQPKYSLHHNDKPKIVWNYYWDYDGTDGLSNEDELQVLSKRITFSLSAFL